ncbi:non-ribosomal peptide synthetase [Talaromyces proteolyticus]|uniref:Non-ribosomal peptide synthetase n=1 Tax=Talaromyces proteolyticus TaxID=1131652 RepID=A0AAD4KCY4_9EURO|nr:non-ribosomal peptide synthetase [Talaromyces proteolyticus]KAH8688637.1 non-ribosomal peptide synthetase [Talaromyces proteolyticus]
MDLEGITEWPQHTAGTFEIKLPARIHITEESVPSSVASLAFTPSPDNSPIYTPPNPDTSTKIPEFWNVCVHDEAPDAPAVVAWDGSFTYGELDKLSTRLSFLLILLSVKPESFVPISMDKSQWTTVAILGVLKAGAAFTLLDLSHPLPRLRASCEDLEATIILTQIANAVVVERLCEAWYPSPLTAQPLTTSVSPANALLCPKGVVIEHRAYASGAREHLKVFQIDHTSRVLQFSSYAFDVSIMETLSTLMAGGCLCVLKETERTDPALFIEALNKFNVSHAMSTPSFSRTMPWREARYIRTLILGGEAMHPTEAAFYAECGIRLVNAYGTAECSVNATTEPEVKPGANANCFSQHTGAVVWLVNPDDAERLVAPGTEGELLLEGPIVGRGYLNNKKATATAFIDPPTWLQRLRVGQYQHRLYRTGDLAVQDSVTGSLALLGRKEGQVKIRGQRVELAGIEQHIRETLPTAAEVIVGEVAFIQLDMMKTGPASDSPSLFPPPDSASIQRFAAVQTRLQEQLPTYMIPSIFIRVACIPRTTSGKVNHSILRSTAASLSRTDLQAFASSPTHNTLGLPLTGIGMNDTFVQLGGDSILAVRLVGAARQAGLILDIRDVLGTKRLEQQAQDATTKASSVCLSRSPVYAPFTLLGTRNSNECGASSADIEDVYPCTPLQEGMFAISMTHPGMYRHQIVFQVPASTSIIRFRSAWEATVQTCPILRTRIIQTPQGLLQVVIRENLTWQEETSELPILPGSPLMRCSFVDGKLTLTIHHAIWDAWTMELIHNHLELAFQGRSVRTCQPFHSFIGYLQETDDNALDTFWRDELAGLEAAVFPSLPSVQYRPSPTATLRHIVKDMKMTARRHTTATYIHLAWSMLVAQYTDSVEAAYGLTVNCRSAPLDTIAEVAGPTIATVPMIVAVSSDDTVTELLEQIHSRTIRMIPHVQTGLQRIAKASADAARACRFQSHLNIQAATPDRAQRLFPVTFGTPGRGMDLTRFANYALNLLLQLAKDGSTVSVDVAYDPQILSAGQVERMMQQWEHILHKITRQPTAKVGEIDLLSPRDREDLQGWNTIMPPADRRCLPDLLLAQGASQPHQLAVSAWDGDFTYRQLVVLTSALARRLKASFAVGPGLFVSICMEKSRWTIVAIIAVLRTGATCVMLDSKVPRQRMQEIISSVSTRIVVNDPATAPLTEGLTERELCMSVQFTKHLEKDPHKRRVHSHPDMHSNPDDLAFVIFTSGSTGKPKGVAMPHSTLSSSIRYNGSAMKVNASTRALHLSSYAFDVSIYEIFTTLAAGGCICVPSEFERLNELAESIQKYAVNWSFMTPSTAQTIDPAEVPSLTTLVLGGEAVMQEHVDHWYRSLSSAIRSLVNGYGPAEATICAVGPIQKNHWKPGVIGHVVGGVGWITNPSDPAQLMSIGAVGELLLEGPFLAQGYLNQPDVTAATFIDPPSWRLRLPFPRSTRGKIQLYRTGDLVKIHGQRVDLAGVEAQVRLGLPGCADSLKVVAEAIQLPLANDTASTLLVAFIQRVETPVRGGGRLLFPIDADFQHAISRTQTYLQFVLPLYMVPSVFVPLSRIPSTVTGKVDRRALRDAILALSLQDLQQYRSNNDRRTSTSTSVLSVAEQRLQTIWTDLLGVPCGTIGSEDTFIAHGGDSVLAMRMISRVRREGFAFTIADVLNNGTLARLAQKTATSAQEKAPLPLSPGVIKTCQQRVGLPRPASDAQAFFIQRYPWTHWQFNIDGKVDVKRLRKACAHLIAAHSILRTRFVPGEASGTRPLQIVMQRLHTPLHTVSTDHDLESYSRSLSQDEQDVDVTAADPPTRFTLVSNKFEAAHIFADLQALYNGAHTITSTDFERFLDERSLHENNQRARHFWRDYLAGSSPRYILSPNALSLFLSSPASSPQSLPSVISASNSIQYTNLPAGLTLAMVIKASVSLVLARRTGQRDVLVGQIVNGRSLPVAGIDEIVGPCVNCIPFRATIRPNMTVCEYLRHIQDQHNGSMDYEGVELSTIIRDCARHLLDENMNLTTKSKASKDTHFEFGIILQHQNIDMDLGLNLAGARYKSFTSSGSLRPGSEVWICSTPRTSAVEVQVIGSSRILNKEIAKSLVDEISAMTRILLRNTDIDIDIYRVAFCDIE